MEKGDKRRKLGQKQKWKKVIKKKIGTETEMEKKREQTDTIYRAVGL